MVKLIGVNKPLVVSLEENSLAVKLLDNRLYIGIQIQTIQLLIFTEKFSPLPGFEPGTSLVPRRYATNWAILAWIPTIDLVCMHRHVQAIIHSLEQNGHFNLSAINGYSSGQNTGLNCSFWSVFLIAKLDTYKNQTEVHDPNTKLAWYSGGADSPE